MTTADRIRELLPQGLDPFQIAERIGCSVGYVYTIRFRLRNPTYKRDWARKWRQLYPKSYELRKKKEYAARKQRRKAERDLARGLQRKANRFPQGVIPAPKHWYG